jgi:zinc transporter ZupT
MTLDLFLLFIFPLLGSLLVFAISGIRKYLKILLAFSGAYLISIVFLHLLPELYRSDVSNIGLFILIGFFIQVLLDYLSQGIEHGHAHLGKSSSLLGLLIGLYLHAFLEGIPMGIVDVHHLNDNHSFLIGVILHKIPIAIVLTTLLLNEYKKRSKVSFQILLFSVIAPLGYLYGHYFGDSIPFQFEQIMALVVGIFIHVGTTIIFESSDTHKINLGKLIAIVAGFLLSVFLIAL